jgi:hypothetical protein
VLKEEGGLLLVGKDYAGNPSLSGIRPDLTNASDNFFTSLTKDQVSMHAWLQRGLSHLEVDDINADGVAEVVYNLSGHWNELRVYNGKTDRLLWGQDFGPDKPGGGYMRGLEVLSAKGSNSKSIIVGTKAGWILAFDAAGVRLWQYHYDSPVSCMESLENNSLLVVGYENGHILSLNSEGRAQEQGILGSAVQQVQCGSGRDVLFGTFGGLVAKYVCQLPKGVLPPNKFYIHYPSTQD